MLHAVNAAVRGLSNFHPLTTKAGLMNRQVALPVMRISRLELVATFRRYLPALCGAIAVVERPHARRRADDRRRPAPWSRPGVRRVTPRRLSSSSEEIRCGDSEAMVAERFVSSSAVIGSSESESSVHGFNSRTAFKGVVAGKDVLDAPEGR